MSKIKQFLSRLIFEEDEFDDDEEEILAEEKPVQKPKPAVFVPEEKPQRVYAPVADLTAGETLPEIIKPEEKPQEDASARKTFIDVDSVAAPAVETKPEPAPVEPEPVKPVEKPAEPEKREYVRTAVISPFFGLQGGSNEPEDSPANVSEPQLAGNKEAADSVIGTVFSPLYGDKTKAESDRNDKVSRKVASLTVDEVIAAPKKVATVERNEPEIRIKDVEEVVPEVKQYPNLKSTMTTWAAVKPEDQEKPAEETRPDLNVTPFGVSKQEVPDETVTLKFDTVPAEPAAEDKTSEEGEQLSLFDM